MKKVYIAMSADIIHNGHLNIINEGRKLGELTIGVLTDQAIASYKRIPFLSYELRSKIVNSIKGVKKVIPQDTLDYTNNLNLLRPDYVLHGDDWKEGVQKKTRDKVIKTVNKWNGKVIDIPYTKGISSSLLNIKLKEELSQKFYDKPFNNQLDCKKFFEYLKYKNIDFYTGVPDSLLKNICAYISDNSSKDEHVISTNEGSAIGLAIGYNLATGKIPLVYMQNSGLGNIINPLLSLADEKVYKSPMILMIGWRGEPGVHDEPQHIKQGEVTLELLDAMGINFSILPEELESAEKCIDQIINKIQHSSSPYALIVRKNTFSDYKIKNIKNENYNMNREEAICTVLSSFENNSCFISTTGKASREVYEYRKRNNFSHEKDFLTVGGMGHTSQIALGIAINKPHKKVICIDGDGSALMHLGGLGLVGNIKPTNLIHVIINNGSHDSVGGQPTIGYSLNFSDLAQTLNYNYSFRVDNIDDLKRTISKISSLKGPIMLEILTKKGSRSDLGRPSESPLENKNKFMNFLNK